MKNKIYLVLSASFLFTSCTSTHRRPASDANSNAMESLYEENIQTDLSIAQDELNLKIDQKRFKNSPEESKAAIYTKDLQDQLAAKNSVQSRINALGASTRSDQPQIDYGHVHQEWRKQTEEILFHDLSPYEVRDGHPGTTFIMDRSNSNDYEIHFVNTHFSNITYDNRAVTDGTDSQQNQPYLSFEMTCDANFEIKRFFSNIHGSANKAVKFQLYDEHLNGQRTWFVPSENLTSCQVQFYNPDLPAQKYALNMVSENKVRPGKAFHQNLFETCYLPKVDAADPVQKMFLTSDFNSMTCPRSVDHIQTLPIPIDGFQAKVQALIGQKLPDAFIAKQDPTLPIDFSKAPQFDEINLSYLVVRNDYSGAILRRILEFHASRGTRVRIATSREISLEKDKLSFEEMTARYPNIKIYDYKFIAPPAADLSEIFSQLHRVDHVKMIMGLSAKDPSHNFVITGGRNIHDGFIFNQAPDIKRFPELVQYPGDESYAFWRDMEYKITDPNTVIDMAAHYLTFWEMDSETFYQRSINMNVRTQAQVSPKYFAQSDKELVRHFISIPFKDQESLERLYVNMFDSAQKEIRLSTPYFNLTKDLTDALARAVERGVKISVITRLNLSGDTADFILSDVNKKTVNKFKDKFSIYEYTAAGEILHAKIVLIDGKLAFVGSVNLNRRSFIHDTEDGLMVYSPAFNKEMNAIMDTYMKQTRRVTDAQHIKIYNKIILGIPMVEDAL